MSATATAAGLYPPKGQQIWNQNLLWQPIPIHTSPREVDHIFPSSSDCPNYKKAYKKVKSGKHFREIKDNYRKLFDYLSETTGMEVTDLRDVRSIRDVLYVYENYNSSYLPPWASQIDRRVIDEATGIYFQRKSYTDDLKKYLAGLFFNKLVSHFDKATMDDNYVKLFMVSAHETSLVPILNSLGAYDFFPPDFSATIIFELRQSEGNLFVKIFYRQISGITELSVDSCNQKCTYLQFKRILSKFNLDYKSWRKACGGDDDDD